MANFFKKALPYLTGAVASGIGNQFSALAPFSAAIGAGAGALTNRKNPLAGAAQGLVGGGVGSALAGGAKNLFSKGTEGAMSKFGSGAMEGLKSFGGSIPGFGGVGTSNPTGAFAKFFAPASSATTGGMTFSSGRPPSNVAPARTPTLSYDTPKIAFNAPSGANGGDPAGTLGPMDMFKKMMPGLLVSGAGNLLTPAVEAPDYSGVKQDLLTRIESGGNPVARAAAMKEYLTTLDAPIGASAEAGVANARLINERQKEVARKAIEDQFRANNGNIMGNSAYNDAITKSNAAYDQNYAAQAAQLQFEYDTQQKAQKQAAANALAGMDDAQLQYLAGLAGLDIMQIQEKTGMDVASAQSIQQLAATAGELMMQKALGVGGVAQ